MSERRIAKTFSHLQMAALVAVCDGAVGVIAWRVLDHDFPPGDPKTWSKAEDAYWDWARYGWHENADLGVDKLGDGVYRVVFTSTETDDGDTRDNLVLCQRVDGLPWDGWADGALEAIARDEAAVARSYEGMLSEYVRADALTIPAFNVAYEAGIYMDARLEVHGPLEQADRDKEIAYGAILDEAHAELAALRNTPGYVAIVRPAPPRAPYGPTACVRCGGESRYHVSSSVSGGPRNHPCFSYYACALHLTDVIPATEAPARVETIDWDHSANGDDPPPPLVVGQVWVGDGVRNEVQDLTDDLVLIHRTGPSGDVSDLTVTRSSWWQWVRGFGARVEQAVEA